jgi:hypothetical protein
MLRKLNQDYTFSDGTVVPKGVLVGVALHQTHDDEVPHSSSSDLLLTCLWLVGSLWSFRRVL